MTEMTPPKIKPYGDHALLIDWGGREFSDAVNDQVHMLAVKLRESQKYIEVIPAYDSLVCVFDLGQLASDSAKRHVEDILARENFSKTELGPIIDIPVYYGGENGPDMERICHHPRLETPRAKVPAGSIGIANWQTGIYGLDSPGGWQIIGRTPLSIFDAIRETPFLLNAGDRVRFIPQ